ASRRRPRRPDWRRPGAMQAARRRLSGRRDDGATRVMLAAMTVAAGARFGPYEIRDLIGRGGMGEATAPATSASGAEVAIKVLSAHLAADCESRERFRREARAVAAISHPNIVAIF